MELFYFFIDIISSVDDTNTQQTHLGEVKRTGEGFEQILYVLANVAEIVFFSLSIYSFVVCNVFANVNKN